MLLSNQARSGVEFYPLADYFDDAQRFGQRLYKHLFMNDSSISQKHQAFCFQRWFVIRDFMRKRRLQRVFVCDSDTLLLGDVATADRYIKSPEVAYSLPDDQANYRWSASAHFSFWSLRALEDFCGFIEYLYQNDIALLEEKMVYHRQHNKAGGICDMTALHLFDRIYPVTCITNVVDGMTFDHQMNSGEGRFRGEYRLTKGGIKEIKWQDGLPFGYNQRISQWVGFWGLHFQGWTKKLLETYANASG